MGKTTYLTCDNCGTQHSEPYKLMPAGWTWITTYAGNERDSERDTNMCYCSLNCVLLAFAAPDNAIRFDRYIFDLDFLLKGAQAYTELLAERNELKERFANAKRLTTTGKATTPAIPKADATKGKHHKYTKEEKAIIMEFPNNFDAAYNKLQVVRGTTFTKHDRQKIYAQWWGMHKKKDKGATISKDIRKEFDVPNGKSQPVANPALKYVEQDIAATKSAWKEVAENRKHKLA